jgi:hypothetical protein
MSSYLRYTLRARQCLNPTFGDYNFVPHLNGNCYICGKASREISGRGGRKNLNFTSKGEENFPIKIEENA